MKEIALIGFVQTLFYFLLLSAKKQKKAHDYLLIIFILCVGAELIYRYLMAFHYGPDNRWLVFFDITYWALFGPVTLFYYLTLIRKVRRLKPLYALNLLPLVIGLLSAAGFLLPHTASQSFFEYFDNSTGLIKAGLNIWDISSPLYLLFTFLILIKHKRAVMDQFSNVSGRDLQWLILLVSGYLLNILIYYLMWLASIL